MQRKLQRFYRALRYIIRYHLMKVLFGLATICITIGAALLGGWSGGLLAFGLMVFVLIWMLNDRPPESPSPPIVSL